MKCVPPYHRLTASTGTLSMGPSLSNSSMAAATERESYQAASTTKRFDCWRSFEGNPGKMSRCLTDPKFYDLLFFFPFSILLKGLVKIRFLSDKAVNLQPLTAIVIICFPFSVDRFCCRYKRNGSGVCVYILNILCKSAEDQ